MALTQYLGLTLLEPAQAQPEVTVNNALVDVDKAITGRWSKDMAGLATYTLTGLESTNWMLNPWDAPAAFTLIVQAVEKNWLVINDAAYDCTIKTATGAAVTVPLESRVMVYCDGTNLHQITNPQWKMTTVTAVNFIAPLSGWYDVTIGAGIGGAGGGGGGSATLGGLGGSESPIVLPVSEGARYLIAGTNVPRQVGWGGAGGAGGLAGVAGTAGGAGQSSHFAGLTAHASAAGGAGGATGASATTAGTSGVIEDYGSDSLAGAGGADGVAGGDATPPSILGSSLGGSGGGGGGAAAAGGAGARGADGFILLVYLGA